MDLKKILESLAPFLVAGVAIALCVGVLFAFFTFVAWGLMLGGVLWLAALAKEFLFPTAVPQPKNEGRVIEHNEKRQ